MAYEMVMPYHLHMPSYFLETFTEYPYLQLVENTIKMEALKIAGIEKMPIYKAMKHILEHEHIDLLIKPVSRRYS